MNDTSGETFHWQFSDEYIIDCFPRELRDNVEKYYADLTPAGVMITGKPWGGQETARTFKFEIRPDSRSASAHYFHQIDTVFPEHESRAPGI